MIWLNLKLALKSIGITRIFKVLKRESIIKRHHPKYPFLYFWFLGVKPEDQNQGIGSSLIADVIKESVKRNYPIYGETSTLRNIPLYEKFKFYTYKKLDFGYTLHLIRREPNL